MIISFSFKTIAVVTTIIYVKYLIKLIPIKGIHAVVERPTSKQKKTINSSNHVTSLKTG